MIEIAADLTFARGAPGTACLVRGWAEPEANFTWSLNDDSVLAVHVQPGAGDLLLELEAAPFVVPPGVVSQPVTVLLNGAVLAEFSLESPATLHIPIPGKLARFAPDVVLHLHHPGARSPAELGLGNDPRRLAVQVKRAVVLRVPADTRHPASAGGHVQELCLSFGAGGNGRAFLRQGWGGAEGVARWAIGHHAEIVLPVAQPGAAYGLILEMHPALAPPQVNTQRIMIGANGALVSMVALPHHMAVGLVLPQTATATSVLTLGFDNIDAHTIAALMPGGDSRPRAFSLWSLRLIRLGRAAAPGQSLPPLSGRIDNVSWPAQVQGVSGLPPEDLYGRFTALRHGCELAEAQRAAGVDRTSLLRFALIDAPRLAEGLATRFALLGRPDALELYGEDGGPYWWLRETNTTLRFRTPFLVADTIPESRILLGVRRWLSYLRRSFLEDLDIGGQVYVLRSLLPMHRAEAEAVALALGLNGKHTLLWLTQQGELPAGAVRALRPGLLQGELDVTGRYATASQQAWISCMANAWRLVEEARLF